MPTIKSQIAYLEKTIKEREKANLDTVKERELLKDWKLWFKKHGESKEMK